jgi:hypothetical protein
MFSFAAGVAVGAALWGNCNWHGGSVNVNVNQYNSYSRNVNTTNVATQRTQIQNTNVQGGASNWQHNPEHRKGAQYRDPATQQRYNKGASPQATQARESYRGRAEQGRQQLSQGGAEQFRQGAAGTSPRSGQTREAGAATRPSQGQTREAGGNLGAQRGDAGGRAGAGAAAGQGRAASGGGAFEGMGQGREVQQFSNRGQASRQTMNADRASGFQGKAPTGSARSGGAAARSGSGGGGGGGRRR